MLYSCTVYYSIQQGDFLLCRSTNIAAVPAGKSLKKWYVSLRLENPRNVQNARATTQNDSSQELHRWAAAPAHQAAPAPHRDLSAERNRPGAAAQSF